MMLVITVFLALASISYPSIRLLFCERMKPSCASTSLGQLRVASGWKKRPESGVE